MTSDRIKEIQESTAYPESVSVKQALLQVWNECEQEQRLNAGKWISVDERLPEADTDVLMCNVNDEWVTSGYIDSEYMKWFNQFDGPEDDTPCYPTHWQPLPSLPNHAEQKNK